MNQTTNAATMFGFRAVFRGKNSAGEYKRAVRNIYAANYADAATQLGKEGEELVKGVGFKVNYVTILPPLTSAVAQ